MRLDHQFLAFGLDTPARNFDVLGGQGAHHVVDREITGAQACWVHEHLEFPFLAAHDVHAADPGNDLQALLDFLVRDPRQFLHALGAGHGERQYRQGVQIELLDHRGFDVVGKLAHHAADLVADVLHGLGDRDLEFELRAQEPDVFHALRMQGFEPVDRAERFFELVHDLGFHGLGAGARVDHGHGHERQIHVGHEFHADVRVDPGAEDQQHTDHHGGEHGPPNGYLGQLHREASEPGSATRASA